MSVVELTGLESAEGELFKELKDHLIQVVKDGMKMIQVNTKSVLTFDEALTYSGLSKSKLYKLTSGGKVPCYKPTGGKLYFDIKELNNWLLSNRLSNNSEVSAEAKRIMKDLGI